MDALLLLVAGFCISLTDLLPCQIMPYWCWLLLVFIMSLCHASVMLCVGNSLATRTTYEYKWAVVQPSPSLAALTGCYGYSFESLRWSLPARIPRHFLLYYNNWHVYISHNMFRPSLYRKTPSEYEYDTRQRWYWEWCATSQTQVFGLQYRMMPSKCENKP